ncbi:MAG TPA: glutamate 5-kinase, partial [Candidatus Brocadiia bacterium]|nr:glutamate 5-kinase [Candidatus Brocadiia bacterium]
MSPQRRLGIVKKVKRVVVKVGTAVLTTPTGTLDEDQVARLADQVALLCERGVKVVVVTSGAIGAGMATLGMKKRPAELPRLQAAAAVGQGKLIAAYEKHFSRKGFHAAQILLTREDLDERRRYLNVSNTLHTLLSMGAIPVVNENDTISVEEIGFLENDALSMLTAGLVQADLLVALSSIRGLYENPSAPLEQRRVVEVVEGVDGAVAALASGEKSARGSGGMEAKLKAVSAATSIGIPVVIADGREDRVLLRLFDGENLGTLFIPKPEREESRKLWIRFGGRPRGMIRVDEGASKALVAGGKSLLPSGIVAVEGAFERGDVVLVAARDGAEIGRGLANYSAAEVDKIKGLKTPAIAGA